MANNEDAFVWYLILLLSIYELGSKSALVQDVAHISKTPSMAWSFGASSTFSLLSSPLITFPSSLCVQILHALTAEVTHITLQVGSQGMFRDQADVPDVEGVWFELVRNACPDSL